MRNDSPKNRAERKRLLLARLLKERGHKRREGIAPIPRNEAMVPSFAQQRLWFLDQLAGGGSYFYNVCAHISLVGALDVSRLEHAIAGLTRRHEALRTCFSEQDGKVVQHIAEVGRPPLVFAASPLDGIDVGELARITREEARQVMPLGRAPLWRLRLVRLRPAEHVLIVTIHHIISDGWSYNVIVRELAALYRGDELAPLRVQYADYAAWQRKWLSGARLERQLNYWRDKLAGAATLLALPIAHARPARRNFEGRWKALKLSPELSAALKRMSTELDAPLFMTLLAAFYVLLFRYTQQTDLLIGTPIAGRHRVEVEPLIGLFVNTLVLRADLSVEPTFRALVVQLRKTALDAYEHQDLPFDRVVEALNPPRSVGHNPLFQVMFAFQNTPLAGADAGGLRFEFEEVDVGAAPFDLTVALWDRDGKLEGCFEYATELFEDDAIGRMTAHYTTLLEAVVADVDVPICQLPLLSDAERDSIAHWNAATLGRSESTMHQRIAAQAARTPDAPAVSYAPTHHSGGVGVVLSYRQLSERANQLAHRLLGAGVKPNHRVALCVHRSVDLIVGILGIMKSGAAYVPLDPDYPAERLRMMLDDCGADVLVTTSRSSGLLQANQTMVLDEGRAGEVDRDAPQLTGHCADNLAYVIYTSGSTGKPKGVMVTHRTLVASTLARLTVYAEPLNAYLLLSSYSFDSSVAGIFWTLMTGGHLVLVEKGLEQDVREFARVIGEYGISHLLCLPSLYKTMLELIEPAALVSLRVAIVAGEACPLALPALHARTLVGANLYNEYGPTEATVWATVYRCRGDEQGDIPIGKPIPGTQIHILDAQQQPVPIGIDGEIYIGGAGVTRGYLARPQLTAEGYVDVAGQRLYRTGDVGRWRADGQVVFGGRIDEQVKLRGFRIELGEIAAALLEYEQVSKAVVVLHAASQNQPARLLGFIVEHPDKAGAAGVDALLAGLRKRLPQHMVPAALVNLHELPLLPNGKVDKRRLPVSQQLPAHAAAHDNDYRSDAERTLAAILAEVLGLGGVGRNDNFFELGGDSILSIQVVAKANQAGLNITPVQFFEHPTVAQLAVFAATSKVARPLPWAVSGRDEMVAGWVPLLPIQHWFLEQELPDRHHWNQAMLLRVHDTLDPQRLAAALKALTAHHDVLRQRYLRTGAGWQQLCGATPLDVPLERISLLGGRNAAGHTVEDVANEQHRRFLLSRAPLMRVVWFSEEGQLDQLLLVIHHLCVDGVSWRILINDLEMGLAGRRLLSKTLSYQVWAKELSRLTMVGHFDEEREYWLDASRRDIVSLSGVEDGDGDAIVADAGVVRVSLSADETEALLRELPRRQRTAINEVLLTAVAKAFEPWLDDKRLLIDLEGHGREAIFEGADLSRTVGWFTSIFPVLLHWGDEADGEGGAAPSTASAMLATIKEQLRAVPNRGLGYGALRYLSGDAELRQQLTSLPKAQVAFNYFGQLDGVLRGSPLFSAPTQTVGRENGPQGKRPYVIEINGAVTGGALVVDWTHNPTMHAGVEVEALANRFIQALRVLLSNDAIRYAPSDFPLATIAQATLDQLTGSLRETQVIEDIYPLSPVQHGMLFESLRAGTRSDVYLVQVRVGIDGPLDADCFQRAWDAVVLRHPALRSRFFWEHDEEPVQLVIGGADMMLTQHDAEEEQLAAYLEQDRELGFALDAAPLMRAGLFRYNATRFELVWSQHHLLADGWSGSNVLREVFAVYQALGAGREPQLPAVRPYRDYIGWLRSRDAAAVERFWHDQLRGVEAPTSMVHAFGTRKKAGADGSDAAYRRRQQSLDEGLNAGLSVKLRGLARKLRVTMAAVLTGAWALLVSRYCGTNDVVFGLVVSGRSPDLAGADAMVGMFMGSLPLRVVLHEDDTLAHWLTSIHGTTARLREMSHSSLSQIQTWAQGWCGLPAGTALFDTLFAFENFPAEALADPTVQYRILEGVERTSFPLAVTVEPTTPMSLGIQYDGRHFDELIVERLFGHYRTILQAMVDALADTPQVRLGDIGILTQNELSRLNGWSNPAEVRRGEYRIHKLIEAQMEATPNAPALCFEGERVSYGELDRRTLRLARRLRALGVGPDVLVAVSLERSIGLFVALVAILRAGGAYVPLDPAYPPERLRFMLADSGAGVLLTHSRLKDRLLSEGVEVVAMDAIAREVLAAEKEPAAISPVPLEELGNERDLAYLIYTSGTTGQPKGVAVEHRAIGHSLLAMQEQYGLTADDRIIHKTPYAFDGSIWELLWPLMVGAQVVIACPGGQADPDYLLDLIAQQRATVLFMVPSLLSAFIDNPGIERATTLRQLLCGGEAMPAHLPGRVLSRLPLLHIDNLYGPTEAAIQVTCHRCRGDGEVVPIGRGMADNALFVLDAGLRRVPIGVAGQLYIGGPQLARGYWQREELTHERFPTTPHGRLYRTGDLVRLGEGGELDYLGRVDKQVKIRGLRIELGEIENAIIGHPGVREVVVVARDGGNTRRLRAYYLAADPAVSLEPQLRAACEKSLPGYMVPASFTRLEVMPLTPSGKVDRRALPEPATPLPQRGERTAPRDPHETQLAMVWGEVLGLDVIGIHQNFFELGGDSILSIRVVGRASQLGIRLSPRDVVEHPTIAALARVRHAAAMVGRERSAGTMLLTPIQRWFFAQDYREPHHWNLSLRLVVKERIDVARLRAAVRVVVEHHDALRLRFSAGGASFCDDEWDNLTVVADVQAAVGLQASLSMADGRLLRVVVIAGAERGDEQQQLWLILHHLICDTVSWSILLEDLEAAYGGASLPSKTTSWQCWSARSAERDVSAQLSFWRQQTGMPLPRDGDGDNLVGDVEELRMTLDAATTAALLTHSNIMAVLLKALLEALLPWTSHSSLLVGLEGHGREQFDADVDVSRTVGWFTSMYPLRLERGYVAQQLGAVVDGGVGYGLLRDALDVPEPELLFNYLGQLDRQLSSAGLFIPLLDDSDMGDRSPRGRRSHLLEIGAWVAGGQLRSVWTFAPDIHRRSTIERLAAAFVQAIGALVGPSASPHSIEASYPLSPMQHGMLFHTIADPEDHSYIAQHSSRLCGPLDVAALRAAWRWVASRHAALRTLFCWQGRDEPRQLVLREPLLELRECHPIDMEAWLAEERRDFALDTAPPMRVALARVDDDEQLMVWTFHMALLDGWSAQAVREEVVYAYEARLRGEQPQLPERVSFESFIQWLTGCPKKAAERYWRAALAGVTAAAAWPRKNSGEDGRGSLQLALGEGETAALVEGARAHGLTLNTVVLGAWALLLHRYSGRSDILFGAVDSGRSAAVAGIEFIIGNLINTLPVRVRIDDEAHNIAWLRRLQREQAAGREHGYARLVDIHAWSDVPSGSPLFDTLLVFENYPSTPVQLLGEARLVDLISEEHTHYTMSLFVLVGPTLRLLFEYDASVLSAQRVAAIAGHLRAIIGGLLTDAVVATVPMLSDGQRRALVRVGAAGATSYPDQCFHQLFGEQAQRTPQAIAVIFGEQRLSYAELDKRTDDVANQLVTRGARPGSLIGLRMKRSLDMLIGLLAIMKSGAAYVPLDPAFPQERLRYMIEDAGIEIIIDEHSEVLQPSIARVSAAAAKSSIGRATAAMPNDVAYVIYTSGSTGRPKGVAVPHRALTNFLWSMKDRPGLSAADTLLAVTTISFDIAALELYLPLLVGATLVVADESTVSDGVALMAMLDAAAITTMQATPSSWRLIIEAGWSGDAGLKMLCGGEALTRELADALLERGGELWNMYGPTETTIWSSVARVRRGGDITIGEPIANTQLYVLDQAMRLVPEGVVGALYIGGDGLARGYLGLTELTAERFVVNPFDGQTRIYHTGDLAVRHAGELLCLGRSDQQVKVRGHRIELGEVEAILCQHDSLAQAVVVVRDGVLVAYVVAAAHAVLSTGALRHFLAERLPDYMMPVHFVPLEALPLTPNRKIDRAALPAVAVTGSGEHAPPRGERERMLLKVWQELTSASDIGRDDTLVALGGHSLIAMQAVARVWSRYGVRLSPRAMLTGTLAEVATGWDANSDTAACPLEPTLRDGPLPLSFAQQRLWFLEQLDPGTATYNIPAAWRLRGQLDTAALERRLQAVVARHEALRTTIATTAEGPVQCVSDALTVSLPLVQVASEAALDEQLAIEAGRPFDLSRGPLLVAKLFELKPDDHVLSVVMHHMVSDGWSTTTLARELVEPNPPELTIQYGDYAVWQRRWLTDDMLAGQLDYWKGQLAGELAALALPTDHPRPPERSGRGGLVMRTFDVALTADLRAFAARCGATMYMVLLAGFKALLQRYSGQDDIIVGTPVAGRVRAELEPLIGLFANTLVLRTDMSAEPSFEGLVERVKQVCLAAFSHEDMPFERLVEELRPARDMSITPIFQALFAYQADADDLEPYWSPTTVARTDLSMWVVHGDDVACFLEYSSDLWEQNTIERMLGHYQQLLRQAIGAPRTPVSRLPILSSDELAALTAWNDKAFAVPDGCLHELFEERARQEPDAVAVVAAGVTLTYRQLDRRANQLAHRLIDVGVQSEVLVGICLHRSVEMLVALLAILKAGGAYVPLDPGFPSERLAHMVSDSGLGVLVSAQDLTEVVTVGDGRVVLVDEADVLSASVTSPGQRVQAHNLAYVIYTSGSTGLPKGVQIEHRQAVNLLTSMCRQPGIGQQDVLLAVTTLSFDIALLELFGPLLAGGCCVIASSEEVADGARLAAMLDTAGVTVMQATPATWRLLIAAGWQGDGALKVLCGGEALPADLAMELNARCGALWNLYGPTETTVWSSCKRIESGAPILIGKPIANTTMHILDKHGSPVPIGVVGELYIGGAGVARGYLARPELNATRFVAGRYRTGDMCRYRPDGNIEYQRRVDRQVKVRGYRIELGEIEVVLAASEVVAEAAVVIRRPRAGDARLVAYYVLAAGAEVTVTELRAVLRRKLPRYMVPQHFVELAALPLTANGKVDRAALPEVIGEVRGGEFVAPTTDTQRLLAQLYGQLLGIERVSARDNFFDIGGHSLLSMELIMLIERRMGTRLSPRVILLNNLEQVAGHLRVSPSEVFPSQAVKERSAMAERAPATAVSEPYYFGPSESPLFGVHHGPRSAKLRQSAVLLCPPIGHEYMRSHWAMRRLAKRLSGAGFHVLRFDYSGTGDSAGDPSGSSVARWVADVGVAARELIDLSSVERVDIVGLRLGAALAALAVAGGLSAARLIQWDPVSLGRVYLQDLQRLHNAQLVSVMHYALPTVERRLRVGVPASCDLFGFPFGATLREGIMAIDVRGADLGATVVHQVHDDAGNWNDLDSAEAALLSETAAKQITEMLTGSER